MYDSYLALGDSFTEGLDDRRPDGSFRGWADLVAAELAALSPDFRYGNLAVRGRRMAHVLDQQLPRAETMGASLVTVAAGGNDIIGFRCDVPTLTAQMHGLLARLVATGADVLVFTGFNATGRLPAGRVIAARADAYNTGVRRSAAELGVRVVDLWSMRGLYRDAMWAPDRLHMSSAGHALVAHEVLHALGLPQPGDDDSRWDDEQAQGRARWVAARRADVDWARTYLAPWVSRKVRGRSTGDSVDPKRPELTPVQVPAPRGCQEPAGLG